MKNVEVKIKMENDSKKGKSIPKDKETKTKKLRHKYSGKESELFWNCVDAMGERRDEFYSLGVVLQNLESWVLDQMRQEAPNFVGKKLFKEKK